MTLEQLFAEVESIGLFVNNLFQRHDGRWQANLRDGKEGYEFGRGDTAVAAMRDCVDKAKKSLQTEKETLSPQQITLEDMLS